MPIPDCTGARRFITEHNETKRSGEADGGTF